MNQEQRKKKIYRGFLNRYQWSKPYFKYIVEDIRSAAWYLTLWIKGRGTVKTILVYPHFPSKRASIYRIAKELGFYVTNRIASRPDLAVYWEYQTFRNEFEHMDRLNEHGVNVLNLKSRDISKKFVDEEFEKVFGYSTFVDPTSYSGVCVEKGDLNALHDGRIIECPISDPKKEKVYQILIDNSCEGDLVQDIRIPIFSGTIPFVYIKYRNVNERFKNTTTKTEVMNAEDVLSSSEIESTLEFCKRIGLDFGELDAMRDKSSGLLYIVDVNNTPQSPPEGSSSEVRQHAINLMGQTFKAVFCE